MMDEWKKLIWLFMSASTSAFVLITASVLASTGRQVGSQINAETIAIETLKEYRKYNNFYNKEVYTVDIINLIIETKGEIEIYVDVVDGPITNFSYKWGDIGLPSNHECYYEENIEKKLKDNKIYNSKIIKDANGTVKKIEFYRE